MIISMVLPRSRRKPLGDPLRQGRRFVSILEWDHAIRRSHSWSAKRNFLQNKAAEVGYSAASRSGRVAPRESERGGWRAETEGNLSKGKPRARCLRIIRGPMPWKNLQRRIQRPGAVSRRCLDHSSVVAVLCRMTCWSLRGHGRRRVCSHTEVHSPPGQMVSELTAQMSCKLHHSLREESHCRRCLVNRRPTALLPKPFLLLPRTLVWI